MTGVAKVLFVNKRNEVLLQLRSDRWSFFGGNIHVYETPEQAAVREVKEEIGYNLHFFTKIQEEIDEKGLRVWYFAYMEKEIDELVLSEGDACGFFTYEQAQRLPLTENTKRVLEKIFGWVDTAKYVHEQNFEPSAASA